MILQDKIAALEGQNQSLNQRSEELRWDLERLRREQEEQAANFRAAVGAKDKEINHLQVV